MIRLLTEMTMLNVILSDKTVPLYVMYVPNYVVTS